MNDFISINKTFYKVSDFISWKKRDNLILSPEFQRRSVWKTGTKSYLIDTVIRGLPIPIIFLRDLGTDPKTFEPKREVVDGQQRLRTLISYIAPDLLEDFNPQRDDFVILKAHNSELAGKSFKNLTTQEQHAILNYEFNVHILPQTLDDRDIIQIFRRMNSTNYKLNNQELRNAAYFGEFKSSVYNVAESEIKKWRDWKTFNEDDITRMLEVEYTSECYISILQNKIIGKSTPQIDKFYKDYEVNFVERNIIENRFHEVMTFIDDNFGKSKFDFVFFKKTLIFVFFMYIYNLLYGLKASLSVDIPAKIIPQELITKIKNENDKIKNKTVPSNVFEATQRRTTNIKERDILFNHLSKL